MLVSASRSWLRGTRYDGHSGAHCCPGDHHEMVLASLSSRYSRQSAPVCGGLERRPAARGNGVVTGRCKHRSSMGCRCCAVDVVSCGYRCAAGRQHGHQSRRYHPRVYSTRRTRCAVRQRKPGGLAFPAQIFFAAIGDPTVSPSYGDGRNSGPNSMRRRCASSRYRPIHRPKFASDTKCMASRPPCLPIPR